MGIQTISDLDDAILRLIGQERASWPTLEAYLRALYGELKAKRHEETLELQSFYSALEAAFAGGTLDVPEPEGDWGDKAGFEALETLLGRQVRDLVGFADKGSLEDDLRYLGLETEDGESWYNFDPQTYLECACSGTFSCGGVRTVSETQLPYPVRQGVTRLEWADVVFFLYCGQIYE